MFAIKQQDVYGVWSLECTTTENSLQPFFFLKYNLFCFKRPKVVEQSFARALAVFFVCLFLFLFLFLFFLLMLGSARTSMRKTNMAQIQ